MSVERVQKESCKIIHYALCVAQMRKPRSAGLRNAPGHIAGGTAWTSELSIPSLVSFPLRSFIPSFVQLRERSPHFFRNYAGL